MSKMGCGREKITIKIFIHKLKANKLKRKDFETETRKGNREEKIKNERKRYKLTEGKLKEQKKINKGKAFQDNKVKG